MKVTVIDGHPDPNPAHFCHSIAEAYAEAARVAGHEVRVITISKIRFPVLRSMDEWSKGTLPATLKGPQEDFEWAEHVVIIYPLWLGDLPAHLKAFLEQIARPGLAFDPGNGTVREGSLKGKSARIILTMGMPAFIYKWYFFAHSLKSLKRNVLEFIGIRPVRVTIIGSIQRADRTRWLERIRYLGARAA